jgi:hypothetical protein
MVVSSTSHNLFPLEFILYGIVNAPSLLGSFLGFRLRKATTKETEQSPQPLPRARAGHSESEG